MILNCGGSATICFRRRRPPLRTLCLSSTSTTTSASASSSSIINTDQLRVHLDQLHSEAETTRTKGSNARLRLMRLSEAAEKLQRQALISVQTGRENDARELLFQKKKVMQALEKTKSRIELLDELSAQLNKAIAMKETQLVGTVAQDLEITREDASTQVRIVSPKEEGTANSNENGDSNAYSIKLSEDQEMQVNAEGPSDLPNNSVSNNPEVSLILPIWSENDAISCLKGISSFENFLEHLDKQLSKIEAELATVLRFSTLVLDGEEKPKNSKVQHTMEIFEAICRIRGRIASIMQDKVQTR